ncbi:uncharacterized protein LOC107429040 isoform X1 [Ziziphus jujuba]|uniref:Uncharacterized protein LOC107429040 isoform X1 n=2 Tax=Ziziphus jujuba TaxID=326968 RepID=A0ABM3I252_ZIZJJ|nr:uncharacterized protein LOC107429040 isoform X1 [Ziziphus jujuba]
MREAEEEKPDGLEITSIGSLYSGTWDKKYWSSSRGKDRYPYPVGYQAVRAHNGGTYKMEIQEGLKGPLFLVSSADGHSCSGQTPDIAWDKFQKKFGPGVKIWHGKRFSCRIDGVEFFGFKNPFVQRLLRELVANVNGTAERNLCSLSNLDSKADNDSRCPDTCTYPDLLPYLVRPHTTGKRSRRREIINEKSVSGENIKKPRPQDLTCVAKASNSIRNLRNHTVANSSLTVLNKDSGIGMHPASLPLSVDLIPVQEEKSHVSEDGLQLKSVDMSNHLRELTAPPQEARMHMGLENCKSTGVASSSPMEEKTPHSFQDTEAGELAFPMAREIKNGDTTRSKDCQDNGSNSSPTSWDKETCVKEELIAVDMVISEGLIADSHLEEVGTSNSSGSQEKNDFDSVGQEMMTFLLPQAIPLLKKASRKKKPSVSPSEDFPCRMFPQKDNNGTDVPSKAFLPENENVEQKERIDIQSLDLGSVAPNNCAVHNNVVNHHYAEDTFNHTFPSDNAEESACLNKETCSHNTHGVSGSVDEHNESIDCRLETSGSKNVFCCDEVCMDSNGVHQEGDVYISKSPPTCASSQKRDFVEEVRDACVNMHENSDVVRMPHEINLKTAPDKTEAVADDCGRRGMLSSNISRKETFEKVDAETGNMSLTPVPKLVYSRRKDQHQSISRMKEKYNGPLSESIICRSFGDSSVNENNPATGALLASGNLQMGPSGDKSYKKDLLNGEPLSENIICRSFGESTVNENYPAIETLLASGTLKMGPSVDKSHKNDLLNDEPQLSGPLVGLHRDNPATDSDIQLNCMVSAQAQDQFVSHFKRSQAHFDKKVVGHRNLVMSYSSISAQKQGTHFKGSQSLAKDVPYSLGLKAKKMEIKNELSSIFELVGCYLHPFPVLSILLGSRDSEIHICVLCGLLVDKERNLFIYKIETKEQMVGFPSFVGHTILTLPVLKDYFGREIALDRSGLQFTPDGQCLVLLDCIKTPFCRQGRTTCLCSECALNFSEENAVKIVNVKVGYVSIVTKLRTVDRLNCLLVCEPDHLVAVGDSGRLHLWVMNSAWSAETDKTILPANNCISPGIVELKRIPKCDHLVVGHNGFGEFSLWDISKRILVSRFSASSTSICEFFPVGLFSWQMKGHFSESSVEENVSRMMAATNMWFSEQNKNPSLLPIEGEDIAVWLLVSVISDFDTQHGYISEDSQTNSVGCWRLALLVNNVVILGTTLDPRAAAVGASAGHGIIGTYEGLVYMWDMSTGAKLATMHHFKGGSVSCIATDDLRSGAVAVAGGDCQLLVYQHSQKK